MMLMEMMHDAAQSAVGLGLLSDHAYTEDLIAENEERQRIIDSALNLSVASMKEYENVIGRQLEAEKMIESSPGHDRAAAVRRASAEHTHMHPDHESATPSRSASASASAAHAHAHAVTAVSMSKPAVALRPPSASAPPASAASASAATTSSSSSSSIMADKPSHGLGPSPLVQREARAVVRSYGSHSGTSSSSSTATVLRESASSSPAAAAAAPTSASVSGSSSAVVLRPQAALKSTGEILMGHGRSGGRAAATASSAVSSGDAPRTALASASASASSSSTEEVRDVTETRVYSMRTVGYGGGALRRTSAK